MVYLHGFTACIVTKATPINKSMAGVILKMEGCKNLLNWLHRLTDHLNELVTTIAVCKVLASENEKLKL